MVYDHSVVIPLPQLLDLALGYPEDGAVNFKILHSLLHIMIQQMELTSTKAEFIDSDVNRMQFLMEDGPVEPTLKLEEYIVPRHDVGESTAILDGRPGDIPPRSLGFPGKTDILKVNREPDPRKETVMVVIPFRHKPSRGPVAQQVKIPETRIHSIYEKGTMMGKHIPKPPTSKPDAEPPEKLLLTQTPSPAETATEAAPETTATSSIIASQPTPAEASAVIPAVEPASQLQAPYRKTTAAAHPGEPAAHPTMRAKELVPGKVAHDPLVPGLPVPTAHGVLPSFLPGEPSSPGIVAPTGAPEYHGSRSARPADFASPDIPSAGHFPPCAPCSYPCGWAAETAPGYPPSEQAALNAPSGKPRVPPGKHPEEDELLPEIPTGVIPSTAIHLPLVPAGAPIPGAPRVTIKKIEEVIPSYPPERVVSGASPYPPYCAGMIPSRLGEPSPAYPADVTTHTGAPPGFPEYPLGASTPCPGELVPAYPTGAISPGVFPGVPPPRPGEPTSAYPSGSITPGVFPGAPPPRSGEPTSAYPISAIPPGVFPGAPPPRPGEPTSAYPSGAVPRGSASGVPSHQTGAPPPMPGEPVPLRPYGAEYLLGDAHSIRPGEPTPMHPPVGRPDYPPVAPAGVPGETIPSYPEAPHPSTGYPHPARPGKPGSLAYPLPPGASTSISQLPRHPDGSTPLGAGRPHSEGPAFYRPTSIGLPEIVLPLPNAPGPDHAEEVPGQPTLGRHSPTAIPGVVGEEATGRPGVPPAPDQESVGGLVVVRVGEGLVGGTGGAGSRDTLLRIDTLEENVNIIQNALEGRDHKSSEECCEELRDSLGKLEQRIWDMEHRLASTEKKLTSQTSVRRPEDGAERSSVTGIGDTASPMYDKMTSEEIMISLRNDIEKIKKQCAESQQTREEFQALKGDQPLDSFCNCLKDMENVKKALNILAGGQYSEFESGQEVDFVDPHRYQALEECVEELEGQINNLYAAMTQKIENLQDQTNDMEKQMGLLLERVNVGIENSEGYAQDFSGLNELYNKIQIIQSDLEVISNTSARLMEDRDERSNQLQALAEQLETLRDIKADREELDEALVDKADRMAVNRKVSHDQFDSALEDLSKGLADTLTKLTQQETLWQQALDEMQNEVGNKLDKQEMGPLKEFVNNKLKTLHEKLKKLAQARSQAEAAGAKKKLIRDVNCISCDVDAVMKSQVDGNVPIPPAMAPVQSMKPFLTYEMDTIRKEKERKKFPAKNIVHLEEAVNEQKTKPRIPEVDHMCNRYCGGSHTITTPYQRVTRVGHFVACESGGPEAVQLSPDEGSNQDETPGLSNEGTNKAGNDKPLKITKRSSAKSINNKK